MRKVLAFIADESGATAVEYGLLATILGVGLILTFTAFGDSIKALFGTSETGVGERLTEAQGKL